MPDPYTDSNIALTPVQAQVGAAPAQPEQGFDPTFGPAPGMSPSRLGTALNTGMSPLQFGLSPNFERDVARVQSVLDATPPAAMVEQANRADADRLRAEQKQKIAEAAGKDKAYAEFGEGASAALKKYQTGMAQSPLPAFVPTQETAGDLAMLGSLVGIVGLMAGRGKGMQPALAAMDSMTGMLKGWQQGRKDLYEREYKQFRANFDRTIAAHQEYARELDLAFKTAETNLQAGLADANLAAVKAGDGVMQAAIRQGSLKRAMEIYQGQRQSAAKATELVMNLEAKQAARIGLTPLDEPTLRSMAEQYLAGDKSVLSGLGSGNVGAINRFALRNTIQQVMKEKGLTGADVAGKLAEYAGLTAGMRTAGVRSANAELAVQEAIKMEPLVLQSSEAVDRSDYRLIALGQNGFATQTGDVNIVKFTAALNTFVNVYSRAVSPTGVPTESIRAHAYEMLNTGMSKGQIRGVLEQLNAEMDAALESPAAAFEIFRARIAGRPEPERAPTTGGAKYTVGQEITANGKRYRVTGGDLSGDPDVEEIK